MADTVPTTIFKSFHIRTVDLVRTPEYQENEAVSATEFEVSIGSESNLDGL